MTKSVFTAAALFSLSLLTSISFAGPSGDGPTIKKGKFEYSTYTQNQPCLPKALTACFLDTFVVARTIDNGELVWERRIYFVEYKPDVGAKLQIPVTSLKFSDPKTLEVKNKKGDTFTLEPAHGHMKKPKDAKKYSSK